MAVAEANVRPRGSVHMTVAMFKTARNTAARGENLKVHFDVEGRPMCGAYSKHTEHLLTEKAIAVTCDKCLKRNTPDLPRSFRVPGSDQYGQGRKW